MGSVGPVVVSHCSIKLGFVAWRKGCSNPTLNIPFLAAMAKNRNKKKRNGVASMDIADPSTSTVSDAPQAMDTSESVAPVSAASGSLIRKIKGRPMKRSKTARKMKAIAKAISKSEKSVEKVLKTDSKTSRTQAAKILYD